jgi:hypothetical protein
MLPKFMAISNILLRFGIFYYDLVNFTLIWYIFTRLGIMHQVKSGNPVGIHNKKITQNSLVSEPGVMGKDTTALFSTVS